MRKHLIGTILVLAALTACNKEIDTQTPATVDPVEETPAGKVTLTFKATIGEGTRTIYTNDKTASWASGDKISVCLTDSESYEVVDFTTEDGITFTGDVNPGYTTPVSAIYPADEVYTTYAWNSYFSQENGSVTAVRLADGYELGSADDPGKFIPLIGSYDGEKMEFHHFCSTMKVTLTNIPDDAAYFTFTTNKQKLVSDFTLTGGRMSMVSQEDDVDTRVYFEFEPGSLTTRSFYIPVPDGTLAANSYVALQDGGGADLFKKRITSSPTFGLNANEKDAIRILPEVACWTRNEDWTAYYYGTYKTTSGAFYKGIRVEDVSSSYSILRLTDNAFNNTYGGSVAEYLSSDAFAQAVRSISNPYNGDKTCGYTTFTPGTYHVIILGLDENKKFTGEYNCVKIEYPAFTTPEGWNISLTDQAYRWLASYTVPSDDTQWQYISVPANSLEETYQNDFEYMVYSFIRGDRNSYASDPSKWPPRKGNKGFYVNYTGDYILICAGIDDNYMPTGEYFRLDYSFPVPTEAYLAWIGKWTVSDGTHSDTWTISGGQANHSYTITGIAGQTYKVLGEYNDGSLKLSSQLLEEKYGTNKRDVYLLARGTSGVYSTMDRQILTATMDDEGAVTVTPSTGTAPGGYGIYYKVSNFNGLGARAFNNPITMTKQ